MKYTSLLSLGAVAGVLPVQADFLAGLDVAAIPDWKMDVAFDVGPHWNLFTLNVQSNAEDNYSNSGYSDAGWAALGDLYSDGSDTLAAGLVAQLPVTIQEAGEDRGQAGAEPTRTVFGETSAYAQGFTDAHAVVFGTNSDGFFTIEVAEPVQDLEIAFQVAAFPNYGQTPGDLAISGGSASLSVAVTSSYAFHALNIGDVDAGLITFDLTDLPGGVTLDNIMIAGELGATTPTTSFWADVDADENGWRYSGDAADDYAGIGWIWDTEWPYVYSLGLPETAGASLPGQWMWVFQSESASRDQFYAYVFDSAGGYWVYVMAADGYYYDFSAEAWLQFTL